jgi:hypothetical protein
MVRILVEHEERMRQSQDIEAFEAVVAAESLTPADFFRQVSDLLTTGGATMDTAESLRLAYLANPLNTEAHKAQVHESPFPDPNAPVASAEPEPAEPRAPRRRRAAEKPVAAPPSTAIDPQERDELLAAFRPLERTASEDATAAWQTAQAAFQAGQWEDARRLAQQVGHYPEYEKQAHELLRTLDRQEDFVLPKLNGLAAGLTSARRREAWQDVDQIWESAQAIVEEQHRLGVPTRLPPTLVEQYTRAKNAQEARPLVQDAVMRRRRGEFVESDSLLAEAEKLDPDNAVILAERERCSIGKEKLANLQAVMGKAHVSVTELIEGVEDAATLEQLAPEGPDALRVATSFRRLREETSDRLTQRSQQLIDEIERRASIGEKWSLCGEASRSVDDLLRLSPDRVELPLLEQRLERLSGLVTRAQDLVNGLNAALDAARGGTLLSPITAARFAADLTEAQSIAPDDLSLRSIGTRIAEAISLSLSSPEYLLRDPARFDLSTFYSARELVRLLGDLPGGPGLQALEGYRHALVSKAAQAVVARLDRGLSEDNAAGAQGPVEEALQLALGLSSLPGPESLQAAAELVERVTGQVRRWIYLRFLTAQTLEDVERIASQVADMLVHLRSLPGTPSDTHADLERELLTSIQQAIRHQVGPEILGTLPLQESATRVARANEFITYSLPAILQRLGHPERARSAAVLEVLALAQENIDHRHGRSELFRRAVPIAAIAAGALALVALLVSLLPNLRGASGAEGRAFGPEAALGGDCEYVDGHNICDEPGGPRFRAFYQQPGHGARLGSPLSSKLSERGDVQYFQYARLEYHPDNQPPYDYQYGLLGNDLAARGAGSDAALRAAQSAPPDSSGTRFVQTNHSISDRSGFLTYFNQNGREDSFGYPISEEYMQDGTAFQYFQRARFERRPGEPAVRLGAVGLEYLKDVLGARVCHRLLGNLSDCR